MDTKIIFDHVSKQYWIGSGRESLRESAARIGKRLLSRSRPDDNGEHIWAINDVSFEVKRGEALGIIGQNGAGKTTMLKLISKVTLPTHGRVERNGRISALIELGAGFHPDLTGSENIFLNGAIMGLNRREIRSRFDSIVAFAELEKFINTPVKRYSSGMYARLGFAVAAHVDPDILLVDEVLAVGDEAFQLKCREFIRSFVKSGRISIFVSHNLYAIEQLCDRVLWLDEGKIVYQGAPGDTLRAYMDDTDRRLQLLRDNGRPLAGDRLRIRGLKVMNSLGEEADSFTTGEDISITIDYTSEERLERPYFCVWISEANSANPITAANMLLDNFNLPFVEGGGSLICTFREVPFMPRAYNIWVEVYGADRSQILYKWRVLGGFRIIDRSKKEVGDEEARGRVRFTRAHGIVKVPYKWHL